MPDDRLECYKAPDGWRWRRVAPNGEEIASGEAYSRLDDCTEGARRATGLVNITLRHEPEENE
jgi:hypothetical protein